MSSGPEATPKADTYDNGAPRAADPKASLTDKERATLTKILANPLDFPAEFPGWLDDFVRLRLTTSNIAGLSALLDNIETAQTGELLVVLADYTAQTGVYTMDFKNETWMYLNGATFTAVDYPSLNAFLGTNVLPDTRGRSLWLTGTNTALDLFDNDGVAEASRQPKHEHSDSLAVATEAAHTHGAGSYAASGAFVTTGGANNWVGTNSAFNSSTNPSVTGTSGTGSAHTHALTGSVGSGMAGSDAVAHIAIGSAFVHI